jgi:hypothetical protein
MPPWTLAVNHLRFEKVNHRLGEGVVVGIAAAADRRADAGLRQAVYRIDRYWVPRSL